MNARQALADIHRRRDELTPAIVVDEAREPSSPLHAHFEWDDDVAGEQYRLVQASQLIRRFKVSYQTADGDTRRVREWVSVQRDGAPRPVYEPTREAVADPVVLAALLREARREAAQFRLKYHHLNEYADIVKAMLPVTPVDQAV